MSAMHDYYRAPDRATATWRPSCLRAPAKPFPDAPAFDVVETKWVDPGGSLASLVAVIKGVPYSNDLIKTVTLYPPPEGAPQTEDEWLALPEDSPYREGPEIEELPASARDTLAEVEDARLPGVARRWTLEPLSTFQEGDDVLDVINELVTLARRAKESDQLLYCWWISG
ncbi:hypothetical protein E1292_42540 [Nonomuraea deserti]|uniref:DUF1877 family protein n=1 Tax=Nonomuraea deserti TaxID=1848322 RepID=A0A4V2Y7B3_9ACTN|nr:hypothetical protein [Nonomuraea deserti]TDC91425.1 hypothetical protein E1292_42540 [Nonomuraea deserti]